MYGNLSLLSDPSISGTSHISAILNMLTFGPRLKYGCLRSTKSHPSHISQELSHMAYRPVELRPNVVPGHRLAKLVLSKRCLHLDFWIEGATLFLQARTGGRELLSSHAWDIATCMEINATSTGEDQCFTNSKDPVKRQIAARAHELIVKPLLAEPTPEPFTMRSVCLHYVQFQRLDPITPDMMNFWKAGRGVRRGKPQRTTWGDVGGRLPDVL